MSLEPSGQDSWCSVQKKTGSGPYGAMFVAYCTVIRENSSCSLDVLMKVPFELLALLLRIQWLLMLYFLSSSGQTQGYHFKIRPRPLTFTSFHTHFSLVFRPFCATGSQTSLPASSLNKQWAQFRDFCHGLHADKTLRPNKLGK